MKIDLESIIFIILGITAIFSAIMMISRRNPISSALFLILNFFTISGMYLLLKAQFIAIIQVLVYMGAIMVLFLFVIMLLNLQDEKKLNRKIYVQKNFCCSTFNNAFFPIRVHCLLWFCR